MNESLLRSKLASCVERSTIPIFAESDVASRAGVEFKAIPFLAELVYPNEIQVIQHHYTS